VHKNDKDKVNRVQLFLIQIMPLGFLGAAILGVISINSAIIL
jgi:uncharacterized membrane protein (Fun14 family)